MRAIARRQGGSVSIAQARAAGLSPGQIERQVAAGWLAQEHRGVLRFGTLTPDGELWEALHMAGEHAALAWFIAGHEHAVLRGRCPDRLDVIAPTSRRRRGRLRPHRGRLSADDVVKRRGLPFTSLPRTLLDLAAVLSQPRLEAAVDEARNGRRLHLRAVEAAIARSPGHHGIGRLRAAVARHDPGRGVPREELERMAARFLRVRGFPAHERNAEVRLDDEVYVVDVLFTGRKVVLELDSRTFHDNDPTFVSDRRRIRRFGAHGWQLVPITADDLTRRADELEADIWSNLDRLSR